MKDSAPSSIAPLPRNRFELYWEVVKSHWKEALLVGLLIALFCLPFFAWYFLLSRYQVSLQEALLASADESEQAQLAEQLFSSDMVGSLVMIPCLIIALFGFAGAAFYWESLVFHYHASFGADFFAPLKTVWVPLVVYGFLAGLLYALGVYGAWLLVLNGMDSLGVAGAIVKGSLLFLLGGFLVYVVTPLPLYKETFWQIGRNGFLLFFAAFPQNLLAIGLTLGPLIIVYVLGLVLPFVIMLGLYMAFFLGFLSLGYYLNAQNVFDRFINRKNAPQLLGRRIFPTGQPRENR